MTEKTKRTLWIILLVIAVILGIVGIYLSIMPKNVILDDGTTAEVYITGTKAHICYLASALCLFGSIVVRPKKRK